MISLAVTTRSWDPFHGDENDRYQRLGNIILRRVPRDQWSAFQLHSPALYGNGIFPDLHVMAIDHLMAARRGALERGYRGYEREDETRHWIVARAWNLFEPVTIPVWGDAQ